jgi:hypothetical protein
LLLSTDDEINATCWTLGAYEENSAVCRASALLCMPGSTGPLCGSCEYGYVYSTTSQTCSLCATSAVKAITKVGAMLMLVGVAMSTYAGWLKFPEFVRRSWIVGVISQLDNGAIRVIWSNYQIINSVQWTLNIEFPSPFKELLGILSFFSFDFLSLSCMFRTDTYFKTVLMWSGIPIMLIIPVIFSYWVRTLRTTLTINEKSNIKSDHFFYILVLTYLVLPPVSLKQFQALNCYQLPGRSFLYIDTGISCLTPSYRLFKLMDICFILVYMSIPPIWFALLFRERRSLNPPTTDLSLANFLRDNDPKLSPLRFLFDVYLPKYYYFETLELYRRILFVGVLPLLSSKTRRKAAIGFMFALCSAFFYREVEPFRKQGTNILAYG